MKLLERFDRYEKATYALCFLALLTLLWVSRFHEIGGYGVETDFYGSYAWDAQNLLAGRVLEEPDHGPIYTFVLAGFMLVFGEAFSAAKIISVLSAVGFGFFAFQTLRTLFSARLAFYTVLLVLVVLTPHAILASQDVFLALQVALAVYLLFRGNRISRANLFWSGVVSALALLTRYDAAILPAGVALALLLLNPEGWSWKQRFRMLGVYVGAFFLLFAPWLGFNLIQHGHPLPTRLYTAVGAYYYGGFENKIGGEGMAFGARKFDSISEVILTDPLFFLAHYLKTLVRHVQKLMGLVLRFPAFLFFVPGLLLFLANGTRRQLAYFTFPLLGFLILCLTIFNPRYYLYFLPFLFFFVVYFLFADELAARPVRVFERLRLRHVLGFSFVAVVAFNLYFAVQQTRQNVEQEPLELVEAAEALKSHATPSDLVVARKPHLGYLAGLRSAYFPETDSLEELVRYAVTIKARYVLYSEVERQMRPGLSVLANPEHVPPQLAAIYHRDEPLITVYEIRAAAAVERDASN